MSKIHGVEQSIGKVFSEDYAFRIPSYQRPYSWEIEQVSELFGDIQDACQRQEGTSDPDPYFLGSVVLIKKDGAPESEVIDGQQRLTTLAMLLSVLIRHLPENLSAGMKKLLYEEGNAVLGTQDRFRLTIRDRDNSFFENEILKSDDFAGLKGVNVTELSDPQKLLRGNVLYLETQVSELDEDQKVAFATFLIRQTFLIVVSTPSLDSAFRIFSVLNDRGMDLSAADILKAEVIGKISETERAGFTEKWEDAEELLGTDAFSDLFGHIRFIHAKRKAKGTLLTEFREHVNPSDKPTEFISHELVPFSGSLAIVRSQAYESASGAEEVNRFLRYLARLDESDWVAPAILFHTRHRHDSNLLAKFYRDLERLGAALWFLRRDVNQRLERYGELLNTIESNKNLFAEDSPLQLSEEEVKDVVEVLDGDIYNLSKKSKRTMILLRLDELISSGEASYNHSLLTVEHVLPQNPPEGSEWMEWWPDEEIREKEVHRLGNLVLLNRRQNSSAKNYPFEQKKSSYFTGRSGASPFALTTKVLEKETWNPSDFTTRQSELLNVLKDEWRLGL